MHSWGYKFKTYTQTHDVRVVSERKRANFVVTYNTIGRVTVRTPAHNFNFYETVYWLQRQRSARS